MKKITLNSVLSIGIFTTICFSFIALKSDEPNGNMNSLYKISPTNKNNLILQSRNLDTNNISARFTNDGSFNNPPLGFEWPRGSGRSTRFISGLWMGCVVGNDTLTAVAEYGSDYKPGYVDDNRNPQGQNDTLYRIYRIERGDTTTSDYQNWPVNQGAYVNLIGRPLALRSGQDVKLLVFDVLGKEVVTFVNEKLSPGSYEVEFNGSNFSSGIYFYKLETEDFIETKRMVLLK